MICQMTNNNEQNLENLTNFQETTMSKSQKSLFKPLVRIVTSFLLITLGVTIGYRYALGNLPFNLKLGFLDQIANYQHSEDLTRLMQSSKVQAPVSMDVFWEVWQIVERDYYDSSKIDYNKMMDGAISGMVWGLEDPYTAYLPPEENERTGEDLAGSFYGVGIELGYIDRIVGIIAPLAGSPAEKAGVQAGDMILHVKDEAAGLDEDTSTWTLDDAVQNIRGPKGTAVTLTLFQPGDNDSREVEIVRDEIIVESVVLEYVEIDGKSFAHLKLSRFGDRTQAEWDNAVISILNKWNNQEIAGLIFDLRNNPGGYFDTAIAVASDFVRGGTVVSQKSKFSQRDYSTTGKARLETVPTVLLVNKGSASSSEIVAGALRDDAGIKLIGEQTFGKGTVQDRRELSNGGGLHVTVGRWLTPSGDWINDSGLEVDIEVEQDYETEADEVLERAAQEF
ncbi:MAG: Carboxyl-terminal protease [Microgenomates bacterium 39_6]|nr:MAG: Carboxyl-terminal protease [Microgenomates bacterium 39_6]